MGKNVKNYAALKWEIEHLPGFSTDMELKTPITLGVNVSLTADNKILLPHNNCADD